MTKIRMKSYIEPAVKAKVDAIAAKTGAPTAELIRRAIDAYIKPEGK